MNQIIDIDAGKRKAKTRFVVHLILVITLTVGVITGSVLSLIFSKHQYIPNLVINIVLDSFLIIFLLFYFFNLFPPVVYYHKLFKGMNKFSIEHRRKMTYVKEKEERTFNNVRFRVLLFSYKEGEREYQEHLYILDNKVQLKESESYSLDTYQNIIVRFKEISDATI